MRSNRIISGVVLVMAVLAMLAVMGGCKKHENFPTEIELVEAPAPSGFTIDALGIDTDGNYLYDLTWTISDDTNVDHYRLYLLGGFAPELLHDTDAQETADLKVAIKLPGSAAGLTFGLSTVSTGSVESALTPGIVPAN